MSEEEQAVLAAGPQDVPIYQRLKADIKNRIDNGEWPADHRIPSENEIADTLNVSRMTANRALRELATEGVIVRVKGRGSFVANKKRSAPFMGVRNIADEINERGSLHTAQVILAQTEICGHDLAEAMEMEVGSPVFHSVILHHEDDLPIQLEDRFVNPAVAPDYLLQNFGSTTPNAYLTTVAPISHTEQFVEAVLPQAWECKHLAIVRSEPCLLIRRRTWSSDRIVTSVRLLYPGSRYRLENNS